jgi:aarF domain-containing kinase
MKALATFIDSLPGLNWINLKDSMAQFSDTISSQIRLDIEGRHLYQFNNNFDHWKDTKFPEPIIMTESVLVESFEEGQSVKKYADIFASKLATAITMKDQKLPTFDKTLAHFIVTRGEDIYLKMLLNDNLMHADLHPGNIIIRVSNDNKDKEKYKIVLVDAGMVAELLPEEQRNFIGLLEAIGDGDGADAAECLLRFSSKANYTKETKNAFKRDIIEMFKTEAKGYGNNVSIGKVLRGVLNIVRIHKVSIDANYATLVMNSLCLDGLAQSLYPRYNILDNAKPLLRLSRMSRKVIKNRKLSSIVSKIFLPLAQWLKKRGDSAFYRCY